MNVTEQIIRADEEYISPSIRIPFFPIAVRTGSGAEIEDWEGKRYIDFLSAAAIANVGHQHPKIVSAIQAQAAELVHYNAAYAYHKPLAEALAAVAGIAPLKGPRRVALGLSGADANDGAIKLARAATGRKKIIAFYRSYHGNTYGALSLSAVSLNMRRGFGPFLPEVYHVPYPDPYRSPDGDAAGRVCLDHLRLVLETSVPGEEVAAIVWEPIQGDAGVIIPPADFVEGLVEICREYGILLVAEEVQTGMGRTGRWFACEHFGLVPDMVVMGKALGAGMPISALVAREDLMSHWKSPGHVFCTGQNPICCAAATAAIRIIEEERLVSRADELGRYLTDEFNRMSRKYEIIGDVRGKGLLIGVDLVLNRKTKERARAVTAKVCWRCWEKGLFLTFFSGSVLRICPPLVITREQIDRALGIIDESLAHVLAGKVPDSVLSRIQGW